MRYVLTNRNWSFYINGLTWDFSWHIRRIQDRKNSGFQRKIRLIIRLVFISFDRFKTSTFLTDLWDFLNIFFWNTTYSNKGNWVNLFYKIPARQTELNGQISIYKSTSDRGAMLLMYIRDVPGSTLSQDTSYIDGAFWLITSIVPGVYLKLYRDRFLPHRFYFIHLSFFSFYFSRSNL
jgi:hypothetical protein